MPTLGLRLTMVAAVVSVACSAHGLELIGVPPDTTLSCGAEVPPPAEVGVGSVCVAGETGLPLYVNTIPIPTNGSGIAVGADQRIFVCSDDHWVRIIQASDVVGAWGGFGSTTGRFNRPAQLAVTPQGDIVVADRDNHRVQVFDVQGTVQSTASFGGFGSGPGQFNLVDGVGVSRVDGRIAVADRSNHRVQVFDANGHYLFQFGSFGSGPGQLNAPGCVEFGIDGSILVGELGGNRVQRFSADGEYLATIAAAGEVVFPRDMAVTGSGMILVADNGNHRIRIWNADGSDRGSIGGFGTGPGQFVGPHGVAVDEAGRVYVVDGRPRIQVFAMPEAVDAMAVDGLVLHYGFNRDDGAVVADLSGNARTGVVHGATWIADGVGGGCYRFDHPQAWISATDAGLPAGNTARSVSWWFTTPAIHTDGGSDMFSYGSQSLGNYFYFGIDWRNGRRQLAFSPWGWVFLMNTPVTDPGTWYHAVFTYDGQGGKKFYLNGVDATGTSEGGGVDTVLSGLLRIGPHDFSQHPFTGKVDEVRIYNRALAPVEVASLHAAEASAMNKPGEPLVHYRFDVADDIARDSGPQARHGIATGVTFDPDGIDGGAAAFDGSASISIPDLAGVNGATALTWGAWIKLSPDHAGLYGIMGNTMAFDESMYLVHDARGGTTRSYVVPASRAEERIAEATNVVEHGVWQHLVGTYDGRTIRLYAQGVLVQEKTFAAAQPVRSNQVTFAIGDAAAGRGWRFVGSIDDVRIYPRAFTPAEVAALHASTPAVPVVFSESRTGDCPAVITRVWTATDACGNSVAATQVITVAAAEQPDRDSDNDGLLDSEERALGTNPDKADTDGDGRNDGLEVERGTNPLVFDAFPYFVRNDFDGDAASDLGVYDHVSGTWHLLCSRDGYRSAQYGFYGTTPVPGDYDGDRKADIAVFDPANAVWYINGSAGKASVVQWGFRGTVPVPADYDGDGRTDLAVYHGRLGLFFVNGTKRGKFFKRVFLPGGQPVVGDFDGDRAADFAVYQPSTAKWKVQLQAGGSFTRTFGDTNAKGLATDYDGDGKADLATFHTPTGWWTISGSAMGAFKVSMPQAAGGLPVTGDYTGNNKAEAVAFLPLTAEWIFSGKGPGQVVRIQFGGASSSPLGAGP